MNRIGRSMDPYQREPCCSTVGVRCNRRRQLPSACDSEARRELPPPASPPCLTHKKGRGPGLQRVEQPPVVSPWVCDREDELPIPIRGPMIAEQCQLALALESLAPNLRRLLSCWHPRKRSSAGYRDPMSGCGGRLERRPAAALALDDETASFIARSLSRSEIRLFRPRHEVNPC
jgi:hypothetical protein